MKLTRERLKQIIIEEVERSSLLAEDEIVESMRAKIIDIVSKLPKEDLQKLISYIGSEGLGILE